MKENHEHDAATTAPRKQTDNEPATQHATGKDKQPGTSELLSCPFSWCDYLTKKTVGKETQYITKHNDVLSTDSESLHSYLREIVRRFETFQKVTLVVGPELTENLLYDHIDSMNFLIDSALDEIQMLCDRISEHVGDIQVITPAPLQDFEPKNNRINPGLPIDVQLTRSAGHDALHTGDNEELANLWEQLNPESRKTFLHTFRKIIERQKQ